jgi:hypothetical protein
MSTRPSARAARLSLLFASAAVLAACGGGGGDGDAAPSPAPAPPAAPLTLADCDAKPVGLVNTYLNSTRPTRKWVAGTFEGQNVVVREEYDAANVIARRTYYKDDVAAGTSTLVARESYDTAGALERRLKFNGSTLSTALAAGQSQTISYTWDVQFPAGESGSSETLTVRYDGNEAVNLRNGRVDTCKTTITITDANNVPVSTETVHATRNASFVKSYLKSTAPSVVDSGQTYMIELDTSSATVPATTPVAATAPTLASCSALPASLDLTLSAANSLEAASARRTTEDVSWRGSPSRAMRRLNANTAALQSTTHFDPTIGFLATLGFESADGASGILVLPKPDLRSTPLGGTVDFVETATTYPGGTSSTTNQAFTFHGHERVSTPAGIFDACKVTFQVKGIGGYSDTYWLVPGQSFVRSESIDPVGKRTTRERLTP